MILRETGYIRHVRIRKNKNYGGIGAIPIKVTIRLYGKVKCPYF